MRTTFQSFSRHACKALAVLLVLSGTAAVPSIAAQTDPERLLQAIPPHFRIVGGENSKVTGTLQLVPDDQTAAHWTELLTTQIFHNARSTSFIAYRGELERQWQGACDKTAVDYSVEGKQNGYPSSIWVQSCRYVDASKKPNIALVKMIMGNDSAYVVQVNFRFVPDKAKIAQWTDYLDKVSVCDSRGNEHPCPKPAVK